MATLDAGKAFLRKTNADGVSVYSHLTEVLATLLETQPASALDAFEGVSLATKASHYKAGAMVPPEAPALAAVEATAAVRIRRQHPTRPTAPRGLARGLGLPAPRVAGLGSA